MTSKETEALGNLLAQVAMMAMMYYASQGKIPTLEEIMANSIEIQSIIEAEKAKGGTGNKPV